MGKDLERREPQLPDRPELPSAFRDAVLECVKLLAATLPPGVEMELRATDNGTVYQPADLTRPVALPGRLEFDLRVSGSVAHEQQDGWWFMQGMTVDARVFWNGEGEPELHAVSYQHDVGRW